MAEVTITDYVKYHVRVESARIYGLKLAAANELAVEREVYVAPDGKTKRLNHPGVPGWTKTTERVLGAINPKHKAWANYRAAQGRASHLLTLRAFLKLGGGDFPSHAQITAALQPGGALTHHLRRGQSKSSAVGACIRTFHKYANRLRNNHHSVAAVRAWVEKREAEAPRQADSAEAAHAD